MSDMDTTGKETTFTRGMVFGQMLIGVAVATVLVGIVAGFLFVVYAISLALPPDSKLADDPTPDSFPHLVVEEAASDG